LRAALISRSIALVELRSSEPGATGHQTEARHVAPLEDEQTKSPKTVPEFAAMVDNWGMRGSTRDQK